jgi:hypothetical protein
MTNQSTFGRRGPGSNEQRVFRAEIAQPIDVVVRRGGARWGWWVLGAFGLCFVVGVIGNLTEGSRPSTSLTPRAPRCCNRLSLRIAAQR